MARNWQDSPVEKVYSAALAGDPYARLAIELLPDRTEAAVTKSRKRKKAATPLGQVYKNLAWYEQVAALRGSQPDVLKAARAVAAAGYSESDYLRALRQQDHYLARELGDR